MKTNRRKAFITGSNSTCHYHIRQHYEVYREKCKAASIPEQHWAILRDIWEAMEDEKGSVTQKTLDGTFKKVTLPTEFTHKGICDALAKFIVCDDQVSA
jgi:hypothetical protein